MTKATAVGGMTLVTRQMHSTIEGLWPSLPKQARTFLLETPLESLDLHKLAEFWSSPMGVEHACSPRLAKRVHDDSIKMALNYLYLGKTREARALMLNGFFAIECMGQCSGIEKIAQWCHDNPNAPCPPKLANFRHAFYSVKTPEAMEALLEQKIVEFQKSPRDMAKFVGQSVNDYDELTSTSRKQKPLSNRSPGPQIQLIIVDDANREERQVLNIGSSTALKTLFNEYAEKRSVSLRSLRFSYHGQTLFLSSAGNKTPEQMSMKDRDVITAFNTTVISRETSGDRAKEKQRARPKQQTKKRNNTRKKTKGKGKKEHNKGKETVKTIEDYRMQHSLALSKLHQELQPRLKEIRTRLNALGLERQPPKRRRKNTGGKKHNGNAECAARLPDSAIGGKAGRPYFVVSVGEVGNLYKSTKPGRRRSNRRGLEELDLHGCTRDEAVARLDGALPAWVNSAMRGSYPFVIPARIVCGCGNQMLLETVESWIRNRVQVANCPDGFF